MAYKVFEFGCQAPLRGGREAIEQMFRRNRFWNRLVEIELAARERYAAIVSANGGSGQAVNSLKDRIRALRDEIKQRRKTARGKAEIADLTARIESLRGEMKIAAAAAKAERKLAAELHKDGIAAIDRLRREEIREAAKRSELWWCNYDDVLASYDVARRRAMKEGAGLRFHRFDGGGKVSIRYQNGLPAARLYGNDTRLQIDPVDREAWDSPLRSVRRRKCISKLRLRIGSDAKGKPWWLEVSANIDREIPPAAVIRQAAVLREMLAGPRPWQRDRWKVVIVCDMTEAAERQPAEETPGGRTVAVDLGWRLKPEGVRAAMAVDDQGATNELVIPAGDVEQFAKLDDLKSLRDLKFLDFRSEFGAWLKTHKAALPDPVLPIKPGFAQRLDQGRIRAAFRKWKHNRTAGDEPGWEIAARWMERYDHLYSWESNLRDQMLRRRRERFRLWVGDLLTGTGKVIIEDFDLRGIAKTPQPEKQEVRTKAQWYRTVAAPSQLRNILVAGCGAKNIPVEIKASPYTTRECSWCGSREKWDQAAHILHRCGNCGKLLDQDENAGRNLQNPQFEDRTQTSAKI